MSKIVRHLINSAVGENVKRLIYYPTPDKDFENQLFGLTYEFYSTKDEEFARKNVHYYPNVITDFLCLDFGGILITNPFTQLEHAVGLSSQLHIPLFLILNKNPNFDKVKKEDVFYLNEKLEETCNTICLSQEIADNWLLTDYELINEINEIEEIFQSWKTYIR